VPEIHVDPEHDLIAVAKRSAARFRTRKTSSRRSTRCATRWLLPRGGYEYSVPSPKSLEFRCVQMGRLRGGPSRTGAKGAYLDRYVTDEQRSSRPIFNATLRAAASWLFFRVARSTRMTQIWALRSRLEKQPTDLRRNSRDLGDGTLGPKDPTDELGTETGASSEAGAISTCPRCGTKMPASRPVDRCSSNPKCQPGRASLPKKPGLPVTASARPTSRIRTTNGHR
jgi:hypothetical protein